MVTDGPVCPLGPDSAGGLSTQLVPDGALAFGAQSCPPLLLVVISQSAALPVEHVHTALAPAGGAFAIPRRLTAVRLASGAVTINVSMPAPVDVL
jgi:hypothetical protein